MKIFIDTNILLGLYHLSGPDLDELKKIIKLAENNQIEILLPQQVADEFWRNRERVILDALKVFAKTKAEQFLPNIVRLNPKSYELSNAVAQVNNLVMTLLNETKATIDASDLAADKIIEVLLNECQPVSPEHVQKAILRRQLGNPPGKGDSIGDAVNWEWLLGNSSISDDLTIISDDGDFESGFSPVKPKEFLIREWEKVTGNGSLTLYKSLPEFLKAHFPHIKLSGEIDKFAAIEKLEKSPNFAATHAAITRLNQFDDFTDDDVIRLATAYGTNGQVNAIFGDSDIKNFAKKIIPLAKSPKACAAVKALQLLLGQRGETDEPDILF